MKNIKFNNDLVNETTNKFLAFKNKEIECINSSIKNIHNNLYTNKVSLDKFFNDYSKKIIEINELINSMTDYIKETENEFLNIDNERIKTLNVNNINLKNKNIISNNISNESNYYIEKNKNSIKNSIPTISNINLE